jgi:hypothetical protein
LLPLSQSLASWPIESSFLDGPPARSARDRDSPRDPRAIEPDNVYMIVGVAGDDVDQR